MNKTLACAILAGLQLAGSALAQAPCADKDQACARQAQQQHPVRRLAYWQAQVQTQVSAPRPLAERIAVAPAPLVEYLRLDNIAHGYPSARAPRSPMPPFWPTCAPRWPSCPWRCSAWWSRS